MCVLSKIRHIIVEEHNKAEHQEEGGRVEGKASKEEERTYNELIVRSCHPVGEANLRKIWEFSRSKVKIHLCEIRESIASDLCVQGGVLFCMCR